MRLLRTSGGHDFGLCLCGLDCPHLLLDTRHLTKICTIQSALAFDRAYVGGAAISGFSVVPGNSACTTI